MPSLHLIGGLQASGKTTLAKKLVEENRNTVRINRDTFRHQFFFSKYVTAKQEELISQLQKEAVKISLLNGYNVIIDDMQNLDVTRQSQWNKWVFKLNPAFKFKVTIMNTSLDECIKRDSLRSEIERIGKPGVMNTALKFGLIPWKTAPWKPFQKLPAVIFDLDGVIANADHRLHYIQKEPVNWEKFHSKCGEDQPNDHIIKWINAVYKAKDNNVIILTGRPVDKCWEQTIEWLKYYGVNYDFIFMRPLNNYEQDFIVKEKVLGYIQRDIPVEFAVEDRQQVIDYCWRKNKIKVYPVAFENY